MGRVLHVDTPLSNVLIAYKNAEFIADRAVLTVPVGKQSDKYFYFPKGAIFRDEAGLIAGGAESPRGDFPISADTFYCNPYGFAVNILDDDRENADAPLNPELDATDYCGSKILLKKEVMVASKLLTSSNWAAGHAMDCEGTWVAGESNTFIADVEYGIKYILDRTGKRPNVMIMDGGTLGAVKSESTVLERIKYVERGIVSAPLIAALFELDEVLIGDALVSTAVEKADGTDFSGKKIWEVNTGQGSALLLYRPPVAGIKNPSSAYLYSWAKNGLARIINRWREDKNHRDVVEGIERFDCKITGSDLGFLFSDTIST